MHVQLHEYLQILILSIIGLPRRYCINDSSLPSLNQPLIIFTDNKIPVVVGFHLMLRFLHDVRVEWERFKSSPEISSLPLLISLGSFDPF